MLFAPEPQQITDQFASEIEDLRTIARMHNLAVGSPERLAALPLCISQDGRLRSDVTEFVRSLQLRDRNLALPDVLSMILTAIGGSSALHRNRDLAEAIDLTGGFLASLGGWPGSSVEPLTDIDNPSSYDPRLDFAAGAHSEASEEDLTGKRLSHNLIPEAPSTPDIEEVTVRDPDGAVSLAEITQALARLERGTLELRVHLDSIDQRICRMEPLLETSPMVSVPEPPPDPPSRPDRPSTSYETSSEAPLIHRDSEHPRVPPRDRWGSLSRPADSLDVLKEQRRISLMSNFPESASTTASSTVLQAPAKPATPPRPAAPTRAAAPTQTAGADPVPHPRMQQPRRDRFSAAREIPGTAAEFDPLYSAPEADLPSRAAPITVPHKPVVPAAAEVNGWRGHSPASQVQIPGPATTRSPEAPVTAEPLSSVSEPAISEPHWKPLPAHTPVYLTEAALPVVAPPLLHIAAVAEPEQHRRSRWVPGVAAAAVLGAAGFLYVNGLPSILNDWVGGSSGNAISSGSQADTPQPTAVDPSRSSESRSVSSAPRASAGGTPPSFAGRTPGAQDSVTPMQSVDRVNGPTFVPGGIMDGYLVAAPRPEYPRLASLAGVKGKVSMEAMISKEGQIEALKVLGGPQLLRDAATNAVRQWQYRPFEVKGHPVEVRTIIRVDVASRTEAAPAD